jgi:hypothetical protein
MVNVIPKSDQEPFGGRAINDEWICSPRLIDVPPWLAGD